MCRGVAVEWLIAFTDEHDCWDWQTNRVSPQCEVQCIRFATDCDAHVTKAAFLRCDATRRDATRASGSVTAAHWLDLTPRLSF